MQTNMLLLHFNSFLLICNFLQFDSFDLEFSLALDLNLLQFLFSMYFGLKPNCLASDILCVK